MNIYEKTGEIKVEGESCIWKIVRDSHGVTFIDIAGWNNTLIVSSFAMSIVDKFGYIILTHQENRNKRVIVKTTEIPELLQTVRDIVELEAEEWNKMMHVDNIKGDKAKEDIPIVSIEYKDKVE